VNPSKVLRIPGKNEVNFGRLAQSKRNVGFLQRRLVVTHIDHFGRQVKPKESKSKEMININNLHHPKNEDIWNRLLVD
jgi:hypothetical protein